MSVSLLFLGLVGCYDAPRTNPFDPALTPAVELLAVTVDSTSGSAFLEWTPYEGKQPFAQYRVLRKVPGLEAVDTVAAIADVRQTSYQDTTLQPEVVYGYWVEVTNQGGFDVESRKQEGVVYALPSIELLEVNFSSDTATGELRWTQYRGPGFAAYEVRRKAPELEEKVVAEMEVVSDTTYTDTFLDGNTEYTYHIAVRTGWGVEVSVSSNEKSGRFYPFDHVFELPEIPDAEPRAVALAVDEQDNLYVARTMWDTLQNIRLMKRGVRVDFLSSGRNFFLFSEVRPDPESSVYVVAGQGRVYVSVRSKTGKVHIAALSENAQEVWIDSVDTEGTFPIGLYLEENGAVAMGDDRNVLYRFGPEGPQEKIVQAFGFELERLKINQVRQMVVGPGVGLEGGDHFFLLVPDQRDYHVLAVTRRPGTKSSFRDGTGVAIDEGVGLEKGQTLTPVALAFDPQRQRLLILEIRGRLQVFDGRWGRQRQYITQWGQFGTGEGEFQIFHPTGAALVVDSRGVIYVADGSGRIQVFAP